VAALLLLAQIIPSAVAFGVCVPGIHANHLNSVACSQYPRGVSRGGRRGGRSVGWQGRVGRGRQPAETAGNSGARGDEKRVILDEGARWVQLERYKALNQIIVGHGDAEGVLEAISTPIVSWRDKDGGSDGRGTMAGMRPVNAVNVATALGKLARAPPSKKILGDKRFVCVLEMLEEMLVVDPPHDMQGRQLAQIAWWVMYPLSHTHTLPCLPFPNFFPFPPSFLPSFLPSSLPSFFLACLLPSCSLPSPRRFALLLTFFSLA
jgi:hypothetical protein